MKRKRILMTLALAAGLAVGAATESEQTAQAAPPPVRSQAKTPASASCPVVETKYIPRTPVRFAKRNAVRHSEAHAKHCALKPDVKQFPRTPRRTRPNPRPRG